MQPSPGADPSRRAARPRAPRRTARGHRAGRPHRGGRRGQGPRGGVLMAGLIEVPSGLEGVIAFDTSIAEPDREGGALRYRGVDIEELVGRVPFEKVWGLLVDGEYEPGLPAAYCELELRTGGYMADLQAMLAVLSGRWGLRQLIDIDD